MRNEILGEDINKNSNIKYTLFIEKLLDVEFSFSKFIIAVNKIFPTPSVNVSYIREIPPRGGCPWITPAGRVR